VGHTHNGRWIPWCHVLLAVSFIFTALPGISQPTELLSPASWTENDLNTQQLERYQKLSANYTPENLYKVNVDNLASALDTNNLTLTLPGSFCGTATFQGLNVQYESSQRFSWYGRLVGDGCCELGYLMLLSRNGERFGQIRVEDDHYELFDIGGENLLVKAEEDTTLTTFCQIPPLDTTQVDTLINGPEIENRNPVDCDVSILVLFTPAAADRLGEENILNRAEESVAITNQILGNSDVAEYQLHFNLAGVEELNIDETGTFYRDVIWDIRVGNGNNAPQLRNLNNADLVVLLVDRDIMDNDNPAGIAYLGPTNNGSYAVVNVIGTNTVYTFSHEVGHLLGLTHEPCSADFAGPNCCPENAGPNDQCEDTPTSINHAHQWDRERCIWFKKDEVRQRSVMSSSPGFLGERIPHFSNPDIEVIGVATGIDGERHNSDILIDNACTVAQFRVSTDEQSISLAGVHEGCTGTFGELCLVLDEVEDPIEWEWEYSWDGINFTHLNQYDNQICVPTYYPPTGATYYYRARVTFPNLTEYVTGTFYIIGYSCLDGNGNDSFSSSTQQGILIDYINPVQHRQLKFGFRLEKAASASYSISDIHGRKILDENLGFLDRGYHKIDRPLWAEAEGILLLHLQAGASTQTIKLLAP